MDLEKVDFVHSQVLNQPFYKVKYKGKGLRTHEKKCNGSCLDFISKYANIYFIKSVAVSRGHFV